MKIETRAIDNLRPDSRNARKHGKKNLATIRASLEQFGQQRAAVIRSDGTVLAGNGMLEAARELGWTDLAVTVVPDDWTDEQARAYALADNRTGELAEWDVAVLDEHLVELEVAGLDIESLGFEPPKRDQAEDDDEVPVEVPADPVTVTGDLWQVGPHRIICGDSSDPLVLDRLLHGVKVGCVMTDPPYGMNLETDYTKMHSRKGSRTWKPVEGDDTDYDPRFVMSYFDDVEEQFWWGADYYRALIPSGGSWIVWDKRYTENGNLEKVHGNHFELCWSKQIHKRIVLRHLWSGYHGLAQEDVSKRVHPTQKPSLMIAEMLERWASAGCAVVDPYAGSGAHLVASAKTGRTGFGVELDPAYVDVIVARLEAQTGEKAVRVNG
jgi:DNA modification methylase